MGKTTRALKGFAKDAFFREVIAEARELDEAARERLAKRFEARVAQVRIRLVARGGEKRTAVVSDVPAAAATAFDPFTPNAMVLLRREGRDALLAALMAIGNAENLRLLAREQQLSVGEDAHSVASLADAIATAAERRLANRRAAAR